MNNTRFVLRNFHDEATLSTEFPVAPGFPVANTQNRVRTRVWRSTDTTEQFVAGTFADGFPRRASYLGLFRHRIHAGAVKLDLYSNDDYTGLAYSSGFVDTVPSASYLSLPTDGFDWGVDEFSSALGFPPDSFKRDPFVLQSPYWHWFDEVEFLSYKITFGAGSYLPYYSYWQVSRIVLGLAVRLGFNTSRGNPAFGFQLGMADLTSRNRSRGGSLRSNRGPIWRTSVFDFNAILEEERAGWLDLMQYVGTGRDFVVSIFPEHAAVATRIERDHMILAQLIALDPLGRQAKVLTKRMQIEEV